MKLCSNIVVLQSLHIIIPVRLLLPGAGGGVRRVVLEAKPRLHHPDGVRHGEGEDAGLRRGQHVHAGRQPRPRVAPLHLILDRAVAEIGPR